MYYGFDMGGTKIELAVFDKDLTQVWQKRVPTPKNDYQALLNVFKTLTLEADNDLGCKGKIGIGVLASSTQKKELYLPPTCLLPNINR